MSKMEWTRPATMVQGFEANDYVSACFWVACINDSTWNKDGSYATDTHWHDPERKGSDREFKHGGNCTNTFAWLYDSWTIAENWTEGSAVLTGTGVDAVIDLDGNGVDEGDTIYWYTTAGDNRRWNHLGTLVASPSTKS